MSARKEKQVIRMVKWRRWGKIEKLIEKDDSEAKEVLARELGNANEEEAYNYLILMLKDSDEKVQLQAIKSLGNLGVERAKVYIQNIVSTMPKEKEELLEAAKEAISKINKAMQQHDM